MEGIESSETSIPLTVDYFDRIKEIPDRHPKLKDFDGVFDSEYRLHSFEEMLKAFLFVYDKEKVDWCINAPISDDNFKYLKQVRRIGLILRESYNFFDSKHAAPEPFYLFLKSLGDFNDQYWLPSNEKTKDRLLKYNVGNFDFSSPSIEKADFKKYVRDVLSEIDEFLETEILSMKEFHDLRKSIRICADSMQVAAAENYEKDLHWLFASLLSISIRLGKQHDDFVHKGLIGKIDYKKTKVEIDPAIVKEFKKIKPFLEKVMGV